MGYTGDITNPCLNLGAAKKFGSLYFGAFLNGNLGLDFTNNSTKTDSSTIKNKSGKTSDFDISLLGGIGNNLGIKVYLSYTGNSETWSSSTVSGSSKTETKEKHQEIIPGVQVGYNIAVKDLTLKNRAEFYVDVAQDSSTTTNGTNNTSETNNTISKVVVGGGSTIVFPEKNNLSQSLDLGLNFRFRNQKATYTTKYSGVTISFVPTYALTYDKIERLNLGLTFAVPLGATFSKTTTTISTSQTDSITTKNSTNTLSFKPSLAFGIQYDVVPEKFTINAGASVASPKLTGTFENTIDSSSSSTGTSTNKNKNNTWVGEDAAGTLTLSTGFNYVLANTVTFDCNYNILGDLFTSTLDSKWATGSTTSVWNNLNLILFHSLNLQVSVKL